MNNREFFLLLLVMIAMFYSLWFVNSEIKRIDHVVTVLEADYCASKQQLPNCIRNSPDSK